jgi:hypothetical protein
MRQNFTTISLCSKRLLFFCFAIRPSNLSAFGIQAKAAMKNTTRMGGDFSESFGVLKT